MAAHLPHEFRLGNRQGLHYTHFCQICRPRSQINQQLAWRGPAKIRKIEGESAKSGYYAKPNSDIPRNLDLFEQPTAIHSAQSLSVLNMPFKHQDTAVTQQDAALKQQEIATC